MPGSPQQYLRWLLWRKFTSFNAANAGKVWLNMTFLVSFVVAIKGRNQQAAKGNQFVSTLYEPAQPRTCSLNTADVNFKRCAVTVAFFTMKRGRSDITWNITAVPGKNENVISILRHLKNRMPLGTRTEFINITMLEHFGRTCCFSTSRKKHSAFVCAFE